MELLLNTIWLTLSLAVLGLWIRRRDLFANCSRCRAIVALAFVLVLLFPFISASDDLHLAQFTNEEAPVSKRLQRTSAVASILAQHSPAVPVSFVAGPVPRQTSFELVQPEVVQSPTPAVSSPFGNRGPPPFSA